MRFIAWVRDRNPLPAGTTAVAVGLAVTGVASYGFLVAPARQLGPEAYGSLSVLWALVFFVGPGVFVPLEQEVARALAARRAVGQPGGAVIRRAAALGGALAAGLVLLCVLAGPWLVEHLFRGDAVLLVALALSIVAYCVANLVKGTLSGTRQFGRYAVYLGGEAVLRLAIALALIVIGATTAGPYGMALGVAPLLAAPVVLRHQRTVLEPGPEVPWRDLSTSLGALLGASVLAQLMVNAGPVLVELLAGEEDKAEVGVFTAALIVARVPLFLFQAVQASLLPRLSALAAEGKLSEFRTGMIRLLGLLGGLVAAGTLAAYLIGAPLVALVFGSEFEVTAQTMGVLAAGSAAYIMAMAMAQAAIALGGARLVAMAWGIGMVVFFAATASIQPLFARVEWGYLIGASVAAVVMAVSVRRLVAGGAEPTRGDVVEALHELPMEP